MSIPNCGAAGTAGANFRADRRAVTHTAGRYPHTPDPDTAVTSLHRLSVDEAAVAVILGHRVAIDGSCRLTPLAHRQIWALADLMGRDPAMGGAR